MALETKDRPYDEIQVGEKATFSKIITEADVMAFADLSGDVNPVHVNPEFAKKTAFGQQKLPAQT